MLMEHMVLTGMTSHVIVVDEYGVFPVAWCISNREDQLPGA